jgi:hypothetical protein
MVKKMPVCNTVQHWGTVLGETPFFYKIYANE